MKKTSFKLNRARQRGVALIASLIIMLLMTIVALSAFKGNSMFEKMAGNTREKQRALQSAQDALLYAEWWLNQGTSNLTPVTCGTTNFTSMQVCATTQTLSGVPSVTHAVFANYKPTGMAVSSGGGVASNLDINYAQNPGIYIAQMPSKAFGASTTLFQVTAFGYGGAGGGNGTVAIVQSLYQLGSGGSSGATSGKNLGGQ